MTCVLVQHTNNVLFQTFRGISSAFLGTNSTGKVRVFLGKGTDNDINGSDVTETLSHNGQTRVDLNCPPNKSTKTELFRLLYLLHDSLAETSSSSVYKQNYIQIAKLLSNTCTWTCTCCLCMSCNSCSSLIQLRD